MVAEPPQNEGRASHPSKDDVSSSNNNNNNHVLPQRGNLGGAGRAELNSGGRRNSSSRRTSPPYHGPQLQQQQQQQQELQPPQNHPHQSPSTSSSLSSPTASSECDSSSSSHPVDKASPKGTSHHQQQQQHQKALSSSPASSLSSPSEHHNLNHHNTHLPSCREQQVPLQQPSCIRIQQPEQEHQHQQQQQQPTLQSQQEPCCPPQQMTEVCHSQERPKEAGGSMSLPPAKIIVTPDGGDEGDGLCSRSRGDVSGVGEGRGCDGERRNSSSSVKSYVDEDELEVVVVDPKGTLSIDSGSAVASAAPAARRNSCGSVNSSNSGKHSIGKVCEGQLWVRGGTLPDLSEFERVWEAAPEVIIKPATLASSETLTPTEALTPTPTHTLDSLVEARSVASDPSAFNDPQDNFIPHDHHHKPDEGGDDQLPEEDISSRSSSDIPSSRGDDLVVGAVGGGGHACGCGVEVGGLDEPCGRCPACPAPADVYVSEQFPSSDPLECVDGSTHTLHVDLATGEVQLHMHVAEPEKGPLPPDLLPRAMPGDPTKCLHEPCPLAPPTTSHDPDGQPVKKSFTFSSGIGEASVYHALVVIFLEFFAWGLLTSPMISVLNETFPDHTFLMNGLIVGIKGILSFLSAPLIGALSDLWGRKFFLFITVFFTCLPIPFMKINTWWYFALISMSGVFAVTFSIVFAYVADVTDESERSSAYGLVSATFAASLVTSPALGAYLGKMHSDDLVVGLATAIAILDVFFILVAVPESLPEKLRLSSSWSAHISWEQADPFSALWKVSKDRNVLLISVSVFLSYLPEAGQYSCFFVYLRLVMEFSAEMVACFIAVVGILSVVAQTALLSLLMRKLSNKHVIIVGLVFEMLQLMWYGFGSKMWMMWAAGLLAAISSITYPAISAYVSTHTDVDKQGVVQGIITGMRGLCSGLGPAVFGFIFYLFHVDLNTDHADDGLHKPNGSSIGNSTTPHGISSPNLIPGPPFVFGALLVICALMVAAFIPESQSRSSSKNRKQSGGSLDLSYERGHKKNDSLDAASLPLMDETDVL